MDACGGKSNSQHVLFCGNVVWGSDTVQIIHVVLSGVQELVLAAAAVTDSDAKV